MNVQDEVEDEPQELQMWSITTGLKGFFQVSVIFCSNPFLGKFYPCTWVYASKMRSKPKVKSRKGANQIIIVRRSNQFSSYFFSPLALPVVAAFTG